MLTIKHIDQSGNEQIISCWSFNAERRADGFMQYLLYPENPMPGEYIATWCGDTDLGDGLTNRQTLYVMNRYGSTVAAHSFVQPNFGQADTEKLAA